MCNASLHFARKRSVQKEWTEKSIRNNIKLRKNVFSRIETHEPLFRKELHQMEISKGVHMLHLPFHGMVIHPTLLVDQEIAVLVDTGIGNLPEIWQKTGCRISVYAHEQDRPYIQGELPLIKDGHLDNPPKGNVTDLLVDGQELPLCGGIRVIHTPGHTEGHISL